jgi:hypothetical protein
VKRQHRKAFVYSICPLSFPSALESACHVKSKTNHKILENQSIGISRSQPHTMRQLQTRQKHQATCLPTKSKLPSFFTQAYCFERNAKQMGRLPWSSRRHARWGRTNEGARVLNLPLWSSPHSVLAYPSTHPQHRSTTPTRAPSCCASRRPVACCGEASWPLSKVS